MSSIYLVLDMQNDLVHVDGPNGKGPLGEQVRERGIVDRTRVALTKARAAGVPIAYIRVAFSADYRECPPASPVFSGVRRHGLLKLGTWGADVHSDIHPQPGDLMVVKHRISPFYGTPLDLLLRQLEIKRIYCSGVTSSAVVQATIREGHDRDYECVVVEDGCASFSSQEHANAMDLLKPFATIGTSSEVEFS